MVRRRTGWPPGLAAGLAILLALAAVGLAAPWLATDRAWIVRATDGLHFPAWSGDPSVPIGVSNHDPAPLLRAPIPYGPNRVDLGVTLRPPSATHWLGTDDLGRDVAARMVHGARVSMAVGLLAAALAVGVGVPLGAWAGYRRRWADFLVSRVVEAGLSFPTLLLALAVLSFSRGWLAAVPDATRIAVVLGLTGWMPIARYVRAEVLKLTESDVVAAARAAGGNDVRIVARHILPSALAPVLVTAAFAVAAAIGTEAALSFLGLGVRPPEATWGVLLAESREQVGHAWWLVVFPGIALFLAILACNLVGEGTRDLLDPRSTRR
ncbi:MAG TPA: ABC transporter permease [Candidatus Polarisedimenticolaceae bacterium]|nr:ABC transporter permease [Candidatus Polarisedimenticolaceae bacterium]